MFFFIFRFMVMLIFSQHFHAAWRHRHGAQTCNINMQHGHTAWIYSMNMQQERQTAWTCQHTEWIYRMDMLPEHATWRHGQAAWRQGHAAWTSSMDMHHGHAACTVHAALRHEHASLTWAWITDILKEIFFGVSMVNIHIIIFTKF
jgi:hypothetical protein